MNNDFMAQVAETIKQIKKPLAEVAMVDDKIVIKYGDQVVSVIDPSSDEKETDSVLTSETFDDLRGVL